MIFAWYVGFSVCSMVCCVWEVFVIFGMWFVVWCIVCGVVCVVHVVYVVCDVFCVRWCVVCVVVGDVWCVM